ncbi:hypothetical protein ES703_78098 [subsurface metagenome]
MDGILVGPENVAQEPLEVFILHAGDKPHKGFPQQPAVYLDSGNQELLPKTILAVPFFGGPGHVGTVQLQYAAVLLHHPLGGDRITGIKLAAEVIHLVPDLALDAAGGVLKEEVQVVIASFCSFQTLLKAEEKALNSGIFLEIANGGQFHSECILPSMAKGNKLHCDPSRKQDFPRK